MAYELIARARMIDQMSGPMGRITKSVEGTERAVKSATRTLDAYRDSSGRLRNSNGRFVSENDKLGLSFGKLHLSVMKLVGGYAALKLAEGAANALIDVSKSALKLSSDAEQASIAFETMLGSADKSAKFLKQLSDFANKTPFELPELRDSAKKMLAFGFSAEQVLPTLTAVGNAASGLGLGSEGIDRITLALGQMRAKSKVSGDEMLQLTEAGIPAWEILAKKMGITTAQVMKMSEKGVIPADKAINALVDGMNAKFPNMMAKQSKTLQGLWSTMKDTFDNRLLVKFGDGIAAALKPRFDKVVTWLDANQAAIDRWGANIQRVTGKVADWFVGAFASVSMRFGQWISDLNADEKFQALTWDQKLKNIMRQAVGAVTSWLADNSGEIVAVATELGVKIGAAIVTGVGTGILQGIKDHNPLTDMSPYTKGIERLNSVSNFTDKANRLKPGESMLGPTTLRGGDNGDSSWWQKTKNATRDAGDFLRTGGGMFSHAGGLSSVPYNGYRAVLHKDERVLTKAEADSSRNGGAPSVTVTGNTFIVRQDSDIDAIARALAKEIYSARGAVAYG